MPSSDILITGGRGFLGTALALELKRRGLGRRLVVTDRKGGSVPKLDLADARQSARTIAALRPSLVFHLAGTTRPVDWEELWKAHVRATQNLMDALAESPHRSKIRVVISGSSGEYGPPPGPGPVGENAPLRPVTAYGIIKLAQWLSASSYGERGLQVMEARIFNVLGPGIPAHLAPGAFAEQIARVELGLQPPRLSVGRLDARRDYLDVRDAASALADIGLHGRAGEVYNVCSGRARPMREILDLMLRAARRPIRVVRDASRARKVEVPRLAGSARKLRALNGWKPAVALEQSVLDTLNWHRGRRR